MDAIKLQRKEFDAMEELSKQWKRLEMTAIVEDDYPEVRHDWERALRSFIKAMIANGRPILNTNGSQGGLRFDELRNVNKTRCARWHNTPKEAWTILEWAGAMAGEAGEACNVAKKIRRLEQGLATKEYDRTKLEAALAEECADTVIYLDLMCAHLKINLGAAIKKKFNEVSEFYKFPERL